MASTSADKNSESGKSSSGRSRLGKGLNALITNKLATPGTAVPVGNDVTQTVKEAASEGADLVKYVPIDHVERNKKQSCNMEAELAERECNRSIIKMI